MELWTDEDHAGEEDRRSTGGWLLRLFGEHGASVPLDWASKKQCSVARSSGEAETVALDDAIRHVVGVNRGLCASGIPSLDVAEKMLGRKMELRVMATRQCVRRLRKKWLQST